MYGSLRGGSIYQAACPASMKRTLETVQRSAEPTYPKGRDFRDSLNDVASAVAFSKSPLPASPGYVDPVPSHYSPPPNKEDMKRTVKEDVAGAHTRLPPSNRTQGSEGLGRAAVRWGAQRRGRVDAAARHQDRSQRGEKSKLGPQIPGVYRNFFADPGFIRFYLDIPGFHPRKTPGILVENPINPRYLGEKSDRGFITLNPNFFSQIPGLGPKLPRVILGARGKPRSRRAPEPNFSFSPFFRRTRCSRVGEGRENHVCRT